ncbi:MAG: alpha/beta hydrolase [Planctomycetes bacterium]|nr:alpha/beta hydrolase [Planctomycetota bacterium]MBI3846332.1 alpha/beta hydrolase [Planctomycetota bacterium]
MQIREYGTTGPRIVLLHGGPGAAGYLAPVARELADAFRVSEPFQRRSGGEPLTVARHVADLQETIERFGDERPALVGHSWGAMLALAYAAAHPGRARSLVLVGCGTFDAVARARYGEIREARLTDDVRRRIDALPREVPDPDQRLRARGKLMMQLDSVDPVIGKGERVECDARAHDESWTDMVRLQDAGVYPAAFATIDAPVLMLHGADDPHPGPMIRASLAPHIRRLEYIEWPRCGHYPWLERHARSAFFAALREAITRQ